MAKGSGTTRSGSASNPRGLAAGNTKGVGRNDYSDLRRKLQGSTYDELVDAIKVMSSAPVKTDGLNELIRVYSEVAEQKKRR